MPGSFKQALEVAASHVLEHPAHEVIIKRGEKVLDRVDAETLARIALRNVDRVS